MHAWARRLLFSLLSALAVACATDGSTSGLLDQIEGLRIEDPEQEGAVLFLDKTLQRLCRTDCRRTSLDDRRLIELAAAVAAVNFYYPGSRVDAHEMVFDAVVSRGLAGPLEVEDLHRTYVSARRWQDARRLAEQFPQVKLEPVPSEVHAGAEAPGSPSVWRIAPVGDALRRESLDLSHGSVLVVISHPDCGFSRRALEALREPKLLDVLPERTYYVMPPFGRIGVERVRRWNREFPTQEHLIVDRYRDWELTYQSWQTPTFLLFRSGVLVATLQGWPGPEQGDKLRALLDTQRVFRTRDGSLRERD